MFDKTDLDFDRAENFKKHSRSIQVGITIPGDPILL